MKKYGGDFELSNKYYCEKNQFKELFDGYSYELFDSGRSAIKHLLNIIKPQKVLLPKYICKSVIDCFLSDGIQIEYYDVNKDLSIDIENIRNKIIGSGIFFFVNYFGKIQPKKILEEIQELAHKNKVIILEDTTHSFLSEINTIGDYCVTSLRKWFDLADGGCLYSKKYQIHEISLNQNLKLLDCRKQAMQNKKMQIDISGTDDRVYLDLYEEGEDILNTQKEVFKISEYSRDKLEHYDFQKITQIRRENFKYLETNINHPDVSKIITFLPNETYLAFPIYVKNRDIYRNYLYKHNVFCPVHWPVCSEILQYPISENILSIMIDQRYDIEDMQYLCKVINDYH